MVKVSKGLCPEAMKGFFQFRNKISQNLRQRCQFHIPLVGTVCIGTEGIKLFGPKILELAPNEMKELENVWEFKRQIKLWKPSS